MELRRSEKSGSGRESREEEERERERTIRSFDSRIQISFSGLDFEEVARPFLDFNVPTLTQDHTIVQEVPRNITH